MFLYWERFNSKWLLCTNLLGIYIEGIFLDSRDSIWLYGYWKHLTSPKSIWTFACSLNKKACCLLYSLSQISYICSNVRVVLRAYCGKQDWSKVSSNWFSKLNWKQWRSMESTVLDPGGSNRQCRSNSFKDILSVISHNSLTITSGIQMASDDSEISLIPSNSSGSQTRNSSVQIWKQRRKVVAK